MPNDIALALAATRAKLEKIRALYFDAEAAGRDAEAEAAVAAMVRISKRIRTLTASAPA